MKLLLKTAALAAAFALAATPAFAQRINTSANGSFGRVSLDAGFTPDPHSVQVTAGGPIDAQSLGESCFGQLPQRASFTLNYDAGEILSLYISAVSERDAVLAVRAPNGAWSCNDDNIGLNPGVAFNAPQSGRYQIYVGLLGGDDTAPATLHISELGAVGPDGLQGQSASGAMPDFALDPTYGAASLQAGFLPDPHRVSISAGGDLDASVIGQPGCVGAIAQAPDYRLQWSGAGGRLSFSVDSASDTTLVINGPGAEWICDDDSGNGALNPSITFEHARDGQYDIWVGTYAHDGELRASTLAISELYSE